MLLFLLLVPLLLSLHLEGSVLLTALAEFPELVPFVSLPTNVEDGFFDMRGL